MNSSGGINNHLGVIGGINIQRNIFKYNPIFLYVDVRSELSHEVSHVSETINNIFMPYIARRPRTV